MQHENPIQTVVLVVVALIYIFVLGVMGASFGGVAQEVANQGINAIVIFVGLILAIPPIGFIVWLVSKAREF